MTAERAALRAEFAKIKASCLNSIKHQAIKNGFAQIHYWFDNAIDQMNALGCLSYRNWKPWPQTMQPNFWDSYCKGLKLCRTVSNHTFHYAELWKKLNRGVQHIQPFILSQRRSSSV